MLKYLTMDMVFREIPEEITLAINITNCKIHCKGCHSKFLWKDIGKELTLKCITEELKKNKLITCICMMGGNSDLDSLYNLFIQLKEAYPDIKLAWYTGEILPNIPSIFIDILDYIKTGPYIKELGGLDKETTNQQLFKIENNKLKPIYLYKKYEN